MRAFLNRSIFWALLVIVLLSAPPALARTCQNLRVFRICLDVHSDVDMGTIDESSYLNPTPQGGGFFDFLEQTGNTVSIEAKAPGWYGSLSWTAQVEVVSTDPPGLDLDDFWVKVGAGSYRHVPFSRSGTGNRSSDLSYRYDVDIDDLPGQYSIELKYSLSALTPSGFLSVNETATLNFDALNWAILATHDGLDLGTIDETSYNVATGLFTSLEVSGENVFTITNDPDGWTLEIEAAEVTNPGLPPGHSILDDFYWRGGAQATYQKFVGIGIMDTIDDTQNSQGSSIYYMDYRYDPDVNDAAGNYQLTLRYTLTTK